MFHYFVTERLACFIFFLVLYDGFGHICGRCGTGGAQKLFHIHSCQTWWSKRDDDIGAGVGGIIQWMNWAIATIFLLLWLRSNCQSKSGFCAHSIEIRSDRDGLGPKNCPRLWL